jgi:transmembrane sensor
MTSHRERAPRDPIVDEAMDWRLRHEEGDPSPAEREAFAAWLAQSPRHREAYDGLERFWRATETLDRHAGYAAMLRQTEAAVGRGRTTRRALAASIAAAVVGIGGLGFYYQVAPKPLANQSFRTAVGQQATVTLPDGSQVTLNTDTVLRTRADEDRRLVYLDKGQAYFKVAKDRRHPFVVAAAGRTVTAVGTAFDVRVDHGELKVVLVEGKVRVEAANRPQPGKPSTSMGARKAPMATDMSAGSELVARDDTEWRLAPTDVDQETSWLKGQLVFADAPLGEVVGEMNRYSTRKIEIADPALATRRVGGNFSPGDVQGFARILQAAGIATLQEQPDGRIMVVATK